MKKNISINLQGVIFHIEEDAYDILSNYLAAVKNYFASYEGHVEITADIEARIAELFMAKLTPAKQVITLEDGCIMGGLGSAVLEFMADNNYQAHVKRLGIPDRFVDHGTQEELYAECFYDADAVIATVKSMMETAENKALA